MLHEKHINAIENATQQSELSIYQHEIYLDQLLNLGSSVYNVGFYFTLKGKFNSGIFKDAVQAVYARHEQLRLQITSSEDHGTYHLAFAESRLSIGEEIIDHAWSEEDVNHRLTEFESTSFAFDNSPLMAVKVYFYADEITISAFRFHHILADARGVQFVEREIVEYYNNAIQCLSPLLPCDQNKYAEFVAEANQYKSSQRYTEDREFWKREFQVADGGIFESALNRSLRAMPNRRKTFQLDFAQYGLVQRWCEENGYTLFQYLIAVQALLCSSLFNKKNIAIGLPLLNRRAKFKEDVGLFANIVPALITVDRHLSFKEYLASIKRKLFSIFRHQQLPFGEIVRVWREQGKTGLPFDVKISYEQYVVEQDFIGIDTGRATITNHSQNHALSIFVRECSNIGIVVIDFDYVEDFIGHSVDIHRVFSTFVDIFQTLYRHDTATLADIPLLSADDRHWVLNTLNATNTSLDNRKTLVAVFNEAVERYPDQPALSFGNEHLSYRTVDTLSNKVSNFLLAHGVQREEAVGLQSLRGFELVIGILGIIKAGCAYVPLDPSHPAERSLFILENSGCRIVLLGKDITFESNDLCIGAIQSICEDLYSSERPDVEIAPDMLAYILYTSGSTGRPKGVMVQHQGVVNRIAWQQKQYPIGPDSTLLQKTPYGFDVSVWELFWWMFTGARLVLLAQGEEKRPDLIISALMQQKVAAIHFVPSMLGVFLEYLESLPHNGISFPDLRYVICSGEALTGTHARTFYALMPQFNCNARLINLYGPTEASIDVSYFDSTPENCTLYKSVPIGKPLDNTRLYVLNASGQLLPPGIAGELHIGGIQLARGYHNNPELTHEKFFYHGALAQRLYKTGDLVRLLANGNIEYLGRLDNQVKVRGNRIELGEIEHTVLCYAGVREAIVTKLNQEDHEDLCCYFVAAQPVAQDSLRLFLKERLPAYMVPTFFVQLDSLPLNANGKLDRRALPAPSNPNRALPQDAADSCSETETLLIQLIQETLSLQGIARHDNFFILGIDSIRIIKLQARARHHGLFFTLADIYEHQTIASLTAHIDSNISNNAASPIRHLEPFALIPPWQADSFQETYDDVFPVTALQMGLIYHSLKNPESAIYHDIFRYRLKMTWDQPAFEKTVENLVKKHAALRQSFDIAYADQPLARIHKRVSVKVKVEQIALLDAQQQAHTIDRYICERKQHRFAWMEAPLYEFCVFNLGEKIELVFSFHHAILDGWSVATLISELLISYTLRLQVGNDIYTPGKTTLADYVALELDAVENNESQQFWKTYLHQAHYSKIRSWTPFYAPADSENASFTYALPADLGAAAEDFARNNKLPLKAVFLSAHCMAQARLSGQSEVITGLVYNGRPEKEDAEKTLGLFLNTLPLRVDTQQPSAIQLVRSLLENEARLGAHRRYPLSRILNDMAVPSVFDTVFNYTDFFVLKNALDTHGITLESWQAIESSNFDLLVTIGRHPENGLYILKIDYRTHALPLAQIEYYVAQFIQALSNINGAEYVGQNLRPAPQEAQQLAATERPMITGTVTDRLNRALAAYGERIALSDGNRDISYQSLDILSARLAGALQTANIGPGSRVGIALPRSIELMVAVIAIVRVGAAYVPVDLNHPQARIRQVLEDASPHLLILDDAFLDRLEEFSNDIDTTTWAKLTAGDPAPFDPSSVEICADTPLYILFTSGSTGRPKGVVMPHGSLANLIDWQVSEDVIAGPELRTLQYAPIAFDVSFQEIFSSLIAGGTLCVIPDAMRFDLARLLKHIDEQKIARIFIPNAALQYLSETALHTRLFPAALRHIVVAGEQLKVSKEVRQFTAQLNDCVLSNHYGPTEAHVVTHFNLTGDPCRWPSLPPIGQPITHAQVWIADASGQPVPSGTLGEIFIAGVCLAAGYWQKPDLTAERFVQIEFNGHEIQAYRTGDIGVQLPSGDIAYVGRSDGQVKVRGYRVELTEVELMLQQYKLAGIQQTFSHAAVIAKQDSDGQSYLAAFLEGGSEGLDLVKVKTYLQRELPEYMVPQHLVIVESMPIGATGKIDRTALSLIPLAPLEGAVYVAPSTHTECLLHTIWCNVLDQTTLSIDADFFDIGGNSLKAVRLVSQVEKSLKCSLSLATFMSSSTIRLLARRLDAPLKLEAVNGCVIPLNNTIGKPPIFMVHPIGGNVLCYAGLAKALIGKFSLYGLQAPGIWDNEAPIDSIPRLADHYIEQILPFCPTAEITLGGWSFGGFVAFQMAVELKRRGYRVNNLFLLDSIVLRKRTQVEVSENQLLNWFFWELLAGDWQTGHKVEWVDFSIMPPSHVFSEIKQRAVALGIFDADVPVSVIARLFQVFKSNWFALLKFDMPTYNERVTLFAARETLPDILVDPHSIVESAHEDALRGWKPYASLLNKVEVDGDHLTLMMSPHIDRVANQMALIIEKSASYLEIYA